MENRFKSLYLEKSVAAPLMATAWNILLVFFLYSLCRIEYFLLNLSYFRPSLEDGRILDLFLAGIKFDTPGIFYTNVLYIFLMLFPLHIKENPKYYKVCKWVFIIINSLAIIINFADSVYFSYTLKRTSWDVTAEFQNESNIGKIFLLELARHWYLVIAAAILIWGLWRLYWNPAINIRKQPLGKYYVVATASLLLAALTSVAAIRGGYLNHWYNYLAALPLGYIAYRTYKTRDISKARKRTAIICGAATVILLFSAPIGGWRHRDIRPIALSNANAYTSHPIETALVLNTPFSIIRTIGNTPFRDPHYYDNKAELDRIYSPLHTPSDSTVMTKRKNIVVIIIESFGKEYIGALNKEILGPDYKGYTPFTDSLISESATWKYSFDNGQKSIDGMPSILASIPKFVKPFIVTPQAMNDIDGIPALLKKKGYDTAFFHGAGTGSMGFNGFAKSIGFDKYFGREDFEKDNRFGGDKDFDGYWAIWDEPFLQFYALKMTELKQPFMTAVFTASNHHPFQIPDKYKNIYPEEEMVIHKCVRYTDNALRRFFETARMQPWYENTIFVITNDHTNMRNHDEYRSDIGSFYGPVIFFDPSGEITPGMREGIIQQIDIMPTLLSHLGYDEPYIAFGEDAFSTSPENSWAVSNTNNAYQYVKYGYVMQYDGERVIGMYGIDDAVMRNNLIGKVPVQDRMETELKAIIQSYMDRMLGNRLRP